MQHADCGSKVVACIRRELLMLYLIWLAAAGISTTFVIIPGCQTLLSFQKTECTTVKLLRTGENSCEFCLKIQVVTTERPSHQQQLQKDEVIRDTWCTFSTSCQMDIKKSTALLDEWTRAYGVNGSKYQCFTDKSRHSNFTVLEIKRYPESVLIQLFMWLGASFLTLLVCTMQACRTSKQVGRGRVNSGYRLRKSWTRVPKFHWKWMNGDVVHETKDVQLSCEPA